MHQKIVVAGGCGYLGSALVDTLIKRGHRVVVDNRLTAATRLPGAVYEDGDIRDVGAWSGLLRDADAVVNLAAVVGDPACALEPDLAWETNYVGTVRLAEACRKVGVPRFVFASTCSNYGHSPNRLIPVWRCPTRTASSMSVMSFRRSSRWARTTPRWSWRRRRGSRTRS